MSAISEAAPVALRHPLPPEERARADLYAVLGRLYAAPPDAGLLAAIAAAPPLGTATLVDHDGPLIATAWDRLRAACSVMDAEAAAQEYVDLFIGVGRSEVNLHASHWLTGFMMEKPLVEVRATLAALGLARKGDASMVEDHLAALFETMRLLVSGHEERPPAALDVQRMVFENHIAPWVVRCCDAIKVNKLANFYRRVAEFTETFMALERDSFAM